jgi:hypothetical protein
MKIIIDGQSIVFEVQDKEAIRGASINPRGVEVYLEDGTVIEINTPKRCFVSMMAEKETK